MIPMLAVRAASLAAFLAVQGLSVVPVGDRTEVVIDVEGRVTVEHFPLTDPPRIVVDITGARYQLAQQRFQDINRGGVLALRASQYQPNVVRVVVDLASSVEFQVEERPGEVRVSFVNPAGPFEPWSATSTLAAEMEAMPEPEPEPQPAQQVDRPVTQPAPIQQPQRVEEPRITIYFRGTPILDVLAAFSEFADRSIVPGQGVSNQIVNADIRDQPWTVALEAILQGLGLDARELESGIIRVAQTSALRQAEQEEPLVTRPFRIEYIPVDSIIPAVEGLLTAELGRVTANKATNTLLVTDRESVVERVAGTIPMLDARTPQVTIKAKIYFVDRTALEGLGIRYEIKDTQGNQLNELAQGVPLVDNDGDGVYDAFGEPSDEPFINLFGSSVAGVANAAATLPSSTLEVVSTLILNRFSLFTWLEALQELRMTDIQAEPVITVLDNRQARVQVGERTPIRVIDAQAAGTGAGAPMASVREQETGVILEVTPHVTGDQVLLDLHAERSNVAAAPSDIGFTFQTQESDTQLLLNDGETAVIAGLTLTENLRTRTGIPILMDLPLIGALFRTTNVQKNKRDLLIMITPHILRDGEM